MLERVLALSSPEVASDLLGLGEDSLEDDSSVALISAFYIETERKRNIRCYQVTELQKRDAVDVSGSASKMRIIPTSH